MPNNVIAFLKKKAHGCSPLKNLDRNFVKVTRHYKHICGVIVARCAVEYSEN
jgi:hypothetical protein